MIIAGSDSGGGAGIQADIKTITMLGGYAMTAITAITAQNTCGVFAVCPVPTDIIARQIEVVLTDIGADCIKIGMLHDSAVINAVADQLDKSAIHIPQVVDPVMVAKGGAPLLQLEAIATLKQRIISHATLMTPNLPEAEVLCGFTIHDDASRAQAGVVMLAMGAGAVLLKGGHGEGDIIEDWLITPHETFKFTSTRLHSSSTHGTGCTLASAIAIGLAQGKTMMDAIICARDYVRQAIEKAPGYGKGHGPLNHGCLLV